MWFLAFFFLLFTSPVHAQDSSTLFEQYKNDYFFQRDQYQTAYINYINKKDIHTQYGTITTQKEKLEATKNALINRNKMLKAYLVALRVELNLYKNSNPTDTEKNQIEISKWEAWFDEQNVIISSINNENDITKLAKDFQIKYVSIQKTIYSALVQNEANTILQVLNNIKLLAQEIQSSPQLSSESQQWFTNLPIKSDLINTSLKNAIELTQKEQDESHFDNFYPDAKQELNKARDYLAEISKDLKAIVIKFSQ